MFRSRGPLKETLEWIETLADKNDLSDEQREKASVYARRSLDANENQLPKTVARRCVWAVRGKDGLIP